MISFTKIYCIFIFKFFFCQNVSAGRTIFLASVTRSFYLFCFQHSISDWLGVLFYISAFQRVQVWIDYVTEGLKAKNWFAAGALSLSLSLCCWKDAGAVCLLLRKEQHFAEFLERTFSCLCCVACCCWRRGPLHSENTVKPISRLWKRGWQDSENTVQPISRL